jgi:hypothetical protein
MPRVAYTVTATFSDRATADEFIGWLQGGHAAAVIAGGAESAMIVRHDPDPAGPAARVEVRYLFPSRFAFDHYIQAHAPALRAEGLARFGPQQGVTFSRQLGTVI